MPDQQVSAYPRHAIFIRREVEFGEVYFVKDNLISIPDADRVVEGRTRHDSRRVLIVQNDDRGRSWLRCSACSGMSAPHVLRSPGS